MQQRVTRSKTRAAKEATNGTSNGAANDTNGTTNGVANGVHKAGKHVEEGLLARLFNRTIMPIFLITICPNVVILLWYTAAHCQGSFMVLGDYFTRVGVIAGMTKIWSQVQIGSPLAVYTILGYSAFQILLQVSLPGPTAYGPITPKGNVPKYTDNGFRCYLVTCAALWIMTYFLKQRGLSPTVVYDHFGDFLATVTVIAFVLCWLLYFKGIFMPSTTDCGSSGNPLFDFYWGTELYPRVLGVDIKVFTNCRFGMTVWPILCQIFALKNYELYGFIDSAWVCCFLQMIYFTKFFWWEAGYMKTIDIMLDRAGFYICWGCMTWVPSLYASVSLYMAEHRIVLGPVISIALMVLGSFSIMVNYWADKQKQDVRATNGECLIWGKKPDIIRAKYTIGYDDLHRDPKESGETKESILLVSGYWGWARHFHYIPELILSLFWSLPGGFTNIMPYLYFLWLCILLTHRTFRDDEKCGKKYGKYWAEYRKRVPYKMIPGIF